ncbi:hypothetical protein DER44DRAFT_858014, partial [Fusarium oxysporum]
GHLHQTSIQIPALIKVSLHFKQAVVWNYIHINDVSSFYCHLVQLILNNRPLQFGKNEYYFIESGQVSWRDVSERIAEAGFSQGLFEKRYLKSLTPGEMCKAIGISFLNPSMVEVIWASNARIKGIKSRQIGWHPKAQLSDFNDYFNHAVKAFFEGQEG